MQIKLSKAAKIMGISVPTMHRWKDSHKHIFKPRQIGLQWFVDEKAVLEVAAGRVQIAFEKKK